MTFIFHRSTAIHTSWREYIILSKISPSPFIHILAFYLKSNIDRVRSLVSNHSNETLTGDKADNFVVAQALKGLCLDILDQQNCKNCSYHLPDVLRWRNHFKIFLTRSKFYEAKLSIWIVHSSLESIFSFLQNSIHLSSSTNRDADWI